MGRHRKNLAQGGWRNKLYAVFFELANVNRELEKRWAQLQNECRQGSGVAGPAASPMVRNEIVSRFREGAAQLERWFDEQLGDINKRYTPIPYNPIAYSYFTLDSPMSDSDGLRQYLHFHRHGESLEMTKAKDDQGDIEAWDKIAARKETFVFSLLAKAQLNRFRKTRYIGSCCNL
jgi:hypothetical protein